MTSLVLIHPHIHAGKQLAAGERLEVDAPSAEWLIAHGIARPPEPSPQGDGKPVEPKPGPTQRKEPKP